MKRRVWWCCVLVALVPVSAAAQSVPATEQPIAATTQPLDVARHVTFRETAAPVQIDDTRNGFTVFANIGFGIQMDQGLDETGTGLAGINVGVGWFLTNNVAALFRVSSTNVTFDFEDGSELQQTSGVIGGSLQFWLTDRFTVEAGAGVGYWSADGFSQRDFGLILGAGAVVFKRGGHNIIAGAEYAPAFTDAGTVHNIGFTVGYQYHR